MRKKNVNLYTQEDLYEALNDLTKGESIRVVAKKYNIPKSTLHSKHKGYVPVDCKKGPSTVLTPEEENKIKKWIINKAKLGFPTRAEDVKDAAQKILNDAKRKTIFKENRPGEKWLKFFFKRHPEITKRHA